MKALPPPSTLPMLTLQLSMPLDTPQMRGLNDAERSAVVARLATLLMAAAGVAVSTGTEVSLKVGSPALSVQVMP